MTALFLYETNSSMKSKALSRYIRQNGIKKSWFAGQLGLSRELFSYYLKKPGDLPPRVAERSKTVIKKIEKNCRFYFITF